MHYTITKQILTKKRIPGAPIYMYLIGLLAIPVIIVAFISLLVYSILIWIKQLFFKKKISLPAAPYFLELPLLENGNIKITVAEDEADKELTSLNEVWEASVYHDETYLYRSRTNPVIPALEGRIVCFYLKELPGGALLQLLPDKHLGTGPLTTQLVFLQYSDLRITLLDEIGLFHLYNNEADDNLIKGFNDEEEIRISLHRS